MKSNSEARPWPLSFFTFLLYVRFYDFTAARIWVSLNLINELMSQWITRLRLSMKRWDGMGQRQRTEDHGKVIFAVFFCFFFFAVIHPTCKQALPKESTIKRSKVRFGTFWWSTPKKCQDHSIFVITVEWVSPVKHHVQKRWPIGN